VRIVATLGCLAILAACNRAPPTGEPNGPIASGRADTNAVVGNGEAVAVQAGELPPQGPGPRFVGKWAADQKSCESAAWQFTQTSLSTPAGSECSFGHVTEVPGGYDIQATCTAEGPPGEDVLKIRFAESAKAMLFESNLIADSGLVFCGRDA
jgi:hypothetical protein